LRPESIADPTADWGLDAPLGPVRPTSSSCRGFDARGACQMRRRETRLNEAARCD